MPAIKEECRWEKVQGTNKTGGKKGNNEKKEVEEEYLHSVAAKVVS